MMKVFTRRLVLQVSTEVPDGGGGFTRIWEDRTAIWGEVRMRSGKLSATEFGERPSLKVRIQTHFLPQGHASRPLPGQRLRDGGRVFVVEAVHDTEGRHALLTILATEIAPEEATP